MNTIEEQKNNLRMLLASLYKAQKVTGSGLIFIGENNPEKIFVSKTVLLKYGFNVEEDDFWDIICPLLKEDGYIKEYPDRWFIGLRDKLYERDSHYKGLVEERDKLNRELPPSYSLGKTLSGKTTEEYIDSISSMTGNEKNHTRKIEEGLEKNRASMDYVENQAKQNYFFIVNEKKILENTEDENSKTQIKDNITGELSKADKTKIYILEKLKEEWDLAPKVSNESIHRFHVYYNSGYEVKISPKNTNLWCRECDIDHLKLENILINFKNEGLINHFEFVSEYR